MLVSERKRRGNTALRAMAVKPPDISEYLRSQGFGPRELATLEAADSAAVAGQLAFELNVPRSEELAKVVENLITAAKKEDGVLRVLDGEARGGSFEIVKNTQASPIKPSTPMFVVYVGRAAERGKTLLARPPQPFREMGRR